MNKQQPASAHRSSIFHRHVVTFVAGLLLLLSASVCAWYFRGAATPIPAYERGDPAQPRHVLIAAQGGMFKQQLITQLVKRLVEPPVFIKVIDVTDLTSVDPAQWQVIVLVHTWEAGSAPHAVTRFVARLSEPGRIVDVTTSSSGREKLPGVDVISSASVRDELPELVTQVAAKIEARLAAAFPGTTVTN